MPALKPLPYGWIRSLIFEAQRAVEDLYGLDRDMHEAETARECPWCAQRGRGAAQ